jgi:hypothetical protein
MERNEHPGEGYQDQVHQGEAQELGGLPRGEAWAERVIREGIEAAELEEREIDDRTARYIALRLSGGQSTALLALASTGEIREELNRELAEAWQAAGISAETRLWVDWLGTYWLNRVDRGPVTDWLSRSDAIDRLEQEYIEQQQEYNWPRVVRAEVAINEEIVIARQEQRAIGDEIAQQIALRLASMRKPARHCLLRFGATCAVSPVLREELRYLSQTRPREVQIWIHELGRWYSMQAEQELLPHDESTASDATLGPARDEGTQEQ